MWLLHELHRAIGVVDQGMHHLHHEHRPHTHDEEAEDEGPQQGLQASCGLLEAFRGSVKAFEAQVAIIVTSFCSSRSARVFRKSRIKRTSRRIPR